MLNLYKSLRTQAIKSVFPICSYNQFSTVLERNSGAKPPTKVKTAAVVLSGCGVYDGSEITEAVSLLIALSARNIKFQCYAVNKDQTDVINHLTGQPLNEKRNTLVESARIARGQVKDIKELSAENYDAVFFPGGFGAAKNLSDYASKGADLTVDKEVERVLLDFYKNMRPIGLACISPVLAAKVLGGAKKLQLTVGSKGDKWPYQGTIDVVEKLGCKAISKQCTQPCSDLKNLVFTAPAFMKDTFNFHEIYTSLDNLVQAVQDGLAEVKERKAEEKEKRKEKRAAKKQKKEDKSTQTTSP